MEHQIPSYLFFRWYKFYFIHVLSSFNQFIKLFWYFLFFLIFWLNNNNMPFSLHGETTSLGFNQFYGIDNSVWILNVWNCHRGKGEMLVEFTCLHSQINYSLVTTSKKMEHFSTHVFVFLFLNKLSLWQNCWKVLQKVETIF